MRYEWDEAKRQANVAKHGVDFAAAEFFDWRGSTIRVDLRKNYGEVRFRAFGVIGGVLHVLVFAVRGAETVRIISLRRANRVEVKRYG